MEELYCCPVCGKMTIDGPGSYEICPYCGYEDDGLTDKWSMNGSVELSKWIYLTIKEKIPDYSYEKYIGRRDEIRLTRNEHLEIYAHFAENNMINVKNSENCGCFRCKSIYSADLVKEWIGSEKERTAICPICGSNTVIPDCVTDIDAVMLSDMKNYYFGDEEISVIDTALRLSDYKECEKEIRNEKTYNDE